MDVTATSPRLALPHGRPRGSRDLAAPVGVDAFRHVLAREVSLQKAYRDPSPAADGDGDGDPRDFEVTLRVVGSGACGRRRRELARSLRAEQAVQEPAGAGARSVTPSNVFATSTPARRERRRRSGARLRALVAAARAVSDLRRGPRRARTRLLAPHETAMARRTTPTVKRRKNKKRSMKNASPSRRRRRLGRRRGTLGHGSVLAFVFGGDAKRAEAAATSFSARVGHRSEQLKKNPDSSPAPTRSKACSSTCDLRDAAVRVPGAPAPLFAAKRLRVTSPVAQARFRSRGSRDAAEEGTEAEKASLPPSEERKPSKTNRQKPSCALAVGRRRVAAAKPPDAPRNLWLTFTDADARAEGRACATPCTASQPWFRSCANLLPDPSPRARDTPLQGGGGGRDAAAARVAAAWRRSPMTGGVRPKRERSRSRRHRRCRGCRLRYRRYVTFRGVTFRASARASARLRSRSGTPGARALAREGACFFCEDLVAARADAGYFSARTLQRRAAEPGVEGSASPGGAALVPPTLPPILEVAASKAAVELEPGSVAVKVARLAFAAKGGGDAERAETDTKDPRGSFSFESPLSDAQLAVIPAAEFSVAHTWRTLGGDDGGLGGVDSPEPHARFSVGVDVAVRATLTTKDAVVKAWREAEKKRHDAWGAKDAKDAKDATATETPVPPVTSSSKNSSACASSPSPLARWMSGDFESQKPIRRDAKKTFAGLASPRSPGGSPGGLASSPNDGGSSRKSPRTFCGFATVSSAAAASVAETSTTPTLIARPVAIQWARDFLEQPVSAEPDVRAAARWTCSGACRRRRRQKAADPLALVAPAEAAGLPRRDGDRGPAQGRAPSRAPGRRGRGGGGSPRTPRARADVRAAARGACFSTSTRERARAAAKNANFRRRFRRTRRRREPRAR